MPNDFRPVLATILLAGALAGVSAQENHWPGFRGKGTSVSEARALPLTWSDDEKVAWIANLKGFGQSSPVIWNNQVYVSSVAGDEKETLRVDCFDLETGEEIWGKRFDASQRVPKSNYVSWAAPTPVLDRDRVYSFFESGDVISLSHQGEIKWMRSLTKDYGDFLGNHGLGSSPALCSRGVVLLVDHAGPSYLICLDRNSGDNVWKIEREERVSWSSPIVRKTAAQEEILISSNGIAESYLAETGQRNWVFGGIEGNTVASPSFSSELMIIGSSTKSQSVAIRLGARGDLDNSHLAWVAEEAASSFGSPLIYGDAVYFVNRAGVVFCNDLKAGRLKWTYRLPASTWASPIAVAGKLYFFSTNGTTTVLQAGGDQPIELAVNQLKTDSRVYGVAAVDGCVVFRMEDRIVCIKDSRHSGTDRQP